MTLLYEDDLTDFGSLAVRASEPELVSLNGRRALSLVDGLAPIPDLEAESFSTGVRRPGGG